MSHKYKVLNRVNTYKTLGYNLTFRGTNENIPDIPLSKTKQKLKKRSKLSQRQKHVITTPDDLTQHKNAGNFVPSHFAQ